jgi:hypothetical protein
MGISNLATKENATNGKWFRFEAFGQKWPFELKILGADSDAVQKYHRQRLRSEIFGKMQSGKFAEITDAEYEEIDDLSDEAVLIRLTDIRGYQYDPKDKKQKEPIGYEPVKLFDKELKANRESFQYLLDQVPEVKDFVLEKSKARANFLSEKKNA